MPNVPQPRVDYSSLAQSGGVISVATKISQTRRLGLQPDSSAVAALVRTTLAIEDAIRETEVELLKQEADDASSSNQDPSPFITGILNLFTTGALEAHLISFWDWHPVTLL